MQLSRREAVRAQGYCQVQLSSFYFHRRDWIPKTVERWSAGTRRNGSRSWLGYHVAAMDSILSLGGCAVSRIPFRMVSTHRPLDLFQVLCVSEYSLFLTCLLVKCRATGVMRRGGTLVLEGSTSTRYSES